MNKQKGQLLTREDLAKMSYTWRIAQDLRIFPPVFGCLRQAVKDKEYNGYLKGFVFFLFVAFVHNIYRNTSRIVIV
jgi:cytochrome P450 family 26 subfamily A